MNNIPLPKSNKKEDIDTTVIAIKNYLDDLRRQLGLDDSKDPDLSGFATKAELQSAVNVLEPVDTIELNNMKGVTSNAVALALSYSTTPVKTGGVWVDGKDVYKVAYPFEITNYSDSSNRRSFRLDAISLLNIDTIINADGYVKITGGGGDFNGRQYSINSTILNANLSVRFSTEIGPSSFFAYFDKSAIPATKITGNLIFYYTKTS